jgi:hypothetical protein
MIFDYECVYQLQGLSWNVYCAREHDDPRTRFKPRYFQSRTLGMVNDHNDNRIHGRQFQSSCAAGGNHNGIAEGFEECLFRIPANPNYRRRKEALRFEFGRR